MSERAPFSGIEILEPGDLLSTDGFAFQSTDRQIIDRLLRLGAVTHRHDGHAAMVDPTTAPTVVLDSTGGEIPAETPIYVNYTLSDSDGGESLPVDAVLVTAESGFSEPTGAPTATPDTLAGSLLAGNYSYAITVTDGLGGETTIGPDADVLIPTGFTNGEVAISGLSAIVNTASGSAPGAGWRLWRSQGGGPLYLIATGAAADDAFTDDGSTGNCTVAPPDNSTIAGASSLSVTVPSSSQPPEATLINIYASYDGTFTSPALLGTYPISDFDSAQVFTDLNVTTGAPPAVSTCFTGANPITEADLGLTWLPPVANIASLPTTATDGDARIAIDGPTINIWAAGAWVSFSAGTSGASVVRQFPFAFDTSGLATGATVYTPTVNDVLLDAWVEIATPWDGTTPRFDFGAFLGITTGFYNRFALSGVSPSALDMTLGDNVEDTNLLLGSQISTLKDWASARAIQQILQIPAIPSVPSLQQPSAVDSTAIGDGVRMLPLQFATADPLKVCVSQDGTTTGADPGSTQGAAILYLVTATPA